MTVTEFIRSNLDYAVRECCREMNCELKLRGVRSYVILNGEKLCQDEKACDCIVFIEEDYITIGIVELKSKTVHVDEAVAKLANSSRIALDILEQCGGSGIRCQLYHMVLCKRWDSSEHRMCHSRKVSVRGKSYHIMTGECGDAFHTLVARYTK